MGDPVTTAMVIGQLGGPMLSSLFAPDGQERSSFEGRGAVDPVTQMKNLNTLLTRVGRGVTDRAATPISLPSSYVQQTPVFSGGGLPMPIGLTGSDPALANPSLLSLQGMGQFDNIFQGLGGLPGGDTTGVVEGPIRTDPTGQTDPADLLSMIGPDPIDKDGFDNFFLPDFDARSPINPNGTTDGLEARPGNAAESNATKRKPYGQLVRGADLMNQDNSGDDMQKAIGAVKLLMEAYQ